MKLLILFAFLFCTIHAMAANATATTRPVRQDGGTRYSLNQTNGQCNGAYNAFHPGYGETRTAFSTMFATCGLMEATRIVAVLSRQACQA